MTILDIARVQWAITTLYITARNDNTFLHEWIFGVGANYDQLPRHTKYDITCGRITAIPVKINANGDKKGGKVESGWGLKPETVPNELLTAEVTKLDMHCADGISYSVWVDVQLDKITAAVLLSDAGNGDDRGE